MKKLTARNTNMKAVYCGVFVTLWMALAFFLFQEVSFETNDDNTMARIMYGVDSTYYDPHLIYINVVLGYIMKVLLFILPNVPWYPILQCLVVAVSFFVLVYLMFSRFDIKKGMFPVLMLILFFGSEFCLNLQFSKTASVATIAGMLLLFESVQEGQKNPYWKWILGGGLTIVGSLYRFNSFGMMLIPLLGIGVMILIKPLSERDFKRVFNICLPFAFVVCICLIFRFWNTLEYQSSELWLYYKEFNKLRAELLDYGFPDYTANQALYESLGISSSDLKMFYSWDFADPDVLSLDAMRQLVAAKVKEPFVFSDCQQALHEFFFGNYYSAVMIIAIIVTAFTRNIAKNIKKSVLGFYVVLAIIGLQVYLYASGRVGLNRVDSTLAILMFVILALYCWGDWKYPGKITPVIVAVLVLLSPFSGFREKKEADRSEILIYELIYSDPGHMYFRTKAAQTTTIPYNFETYPVGYHKNFSNLGGWNTYSIPHIEKLQRFGITNPFRDMVDNPDVYLIGGSDLSSRISYINRHYTEKAVARCVKIVYDEAKDTELKIYRVTTKESPSIDKSKAINATELSYIHYSLSYTVGEDGKTTLTGYCYKDNENSFASSIYIGVEDSNGKERLYYVTQQASEKTDDVMNGQYGSFTTTRKLSNPEGAVSLYLEAEDGLYRIDMGSLAQYGK